MCHVERSESCHSEQLQRPLAAAAYIRETTGVAHVVSGEERSDEESAFAAENRRSRFLAALGMTA